MITTPRYIQNQYREAWKRLQAALTWRYGPERAAEILAARDLSTNDDLAAWRRLGEGGKAA